jgi:hypothetical protein
MHIYLHRNFATNKVLYTDTTYPTLLSRNLQLLPSSQPVVAKQPPTKHRGNMASSVPSVFAAIGSNNMDANTNTMMSPSAALKLPNEHGEEVVLIDPIIGALISPANLAKRKLLHLYD